MKKYYSIKEAAEYLANQINEDISESDVLDLAARGSFRLCIWLQCNVAIFYQPLESYQTYKPLCINKRFRGYVQIPQEAISSKHEKFEIFYAEPIEPMKEKGNSHILSESTIESKKVIRPIKNHEKYSNQVIFNTDDEFLKSIDYAPINVKTEEAIIPAQDLSSFTEKNKNQATDIQQTSSANKKILKIK